MSSISKSLKPNSFDNDQYQKDWKNHYHGLRCYDRHKHLWSANGECRYIPPKAIALPVCLEDVEACQEQEVYLLARLQFNFPWPSANSLHG